MDDYGFIMEYLQLMMQGRSQEAQQLWQSGESAAERAARLALQNDDQGWRSGESAADRAWRTSESEKARLAELQMAGMTYQAAMARIAAEREGAAASNQTSRDATASGQAANGMMAFYGPRRAAQAPAQAATAPWQGAAPGQVSAFGGAPRGGVPASGSLEAGLSRVQGGAAAPGQRTAFGSAPAGASANEVVVQPGRSGGAAAASSPFDDALAAYNRSDDESTLEALRSGRMPSSLEDALRATMAGSRSSLRKSMGGGAGLEEGTIAGALARQSGDRENAQMYARTRDAWSNMAETRLNARRINEGLYGQPAAPAAGADPRLPGNASWYRGPLGPGEMGASSQPQAGRQAGGSLEERLRQQRARQSAAGRVYPGTQPI